MTNQYTYEYNYYCAMNNWRGTLEQYIKWRNTRALNLMQQLDLA